MFLEILLCGETQPLDCRILVDVAQNMGILEEKRKDVSINAVVWRDGSG